MRQEYIYFIQGETETSPVKIGGQDPSSVLESIDAFHEIDRIKFRWLPEGQEA